MLIIDRLPHNYLSMVSSGVDGDKCCSLSPSSEFLLRALERMTRPRAYNLALRANLYDKLILLDDGRLYAV